jgi:hypothetical protein
MMSYGESSIYGLVGALLAEFAYWARFQRTFQKERPAHASSWFYWLVAAGWIVIGSFLPWVYIKMSVNVNFLLCIHAGATAPLTLNQFLAGKVDVT